MHDLALAFLGVIALASLVQGAFFVYLGMSGLRLARRVGEIRKAVEEEIQPAIDNVSRVAGDLAEVSELATAQVRRVQDLVADTAADLFAPLPHGQGQTVLREALLVADHNAYHLGQLVTVRRLIGAWDGEA